MTSNANAIMQYSFLYVFANDGTIDAQELAMIEKLALRMERWMTRSGTFSAGSFPA
jgi:hypothetical protein